MKKPFVFFLTLMFCVSVFSGALGQDLKVGTLFDHTGALQEWGPNFQNAAQLAAKHLASAGFSIEFVHEDSETAAIPAKKAAKKLMEVDKVAVIVGSGSSGGDRAGGWRCYPTPNDMLMISPGSTSPFHHRAAGG